MRKLRILLYPFSLIYGLVVSTRNFLYNKRILSSYEIPLKSITVGNLSIGGTGKSPLVDYLVKIMLDDDKNVATLSRGYGRKTRGFLLAGERSTAEEIGDEPMLYHLHYGEQINVFVSEDRKAAIDRIENEFPDTDIVILDDAYQHRKVHSGLSILVSDYSNAFYKDLLLPAGDLREPRSGLKRADILVISKCPEILTPSEKQEIIKRTKFPSENVFFSRIKYTELVSINGIGKEQKGKALLVTGIARPEPLISYLSGSFEIEHLRFRDHHDFSRSDIREIHKKFNSFAGQYCCVITTEKDYMRLREHKELAESTVPWFYQKIEITIDDKELFEGKIKHYADKN